MAKFIEIEDGNQELRLVNIEHISDVYENYIYLDTYGGESQVSVRCNHSYEELKSKLLVAGAEIY